MTLADAGPNRVIASSCEPRTTDEWSDRVPRFPDYTVTVDPDNPWRWVVTYCPKVEPEYPPDADLRAKMLARRAAAQREAELRAVAGVIEQGTDLVSWLAHRPHRGAVGGMRCFRTYPHADWAVAEICKRDRQYRKKGR